MKNPFSKLANRVRPRRLFISYARSDASIAQALAAELNKLGVETWIDYERLSIGDDWAQSIAVGLRRADGIIIIASEMGTKSEWVLREMELGFKSDVPLLPVVVDDYSFLPPRLAHIQAALISTKDLARSTWEAARQIERWLSSKPDAEVSDAYSRALARDMAQEAGKAGETASEEARHSVFLVHGHDDDAMNEVKSYLVEIGINPIVLREIEEPEDSLLRRFLRVAERATFAVIVISPDDIGAALIHYHAPKGGDNSLRYRARQNVILELGFFLGKLKDFNKVFVLRKPPAEAWPEFEMPSDFAGAIFKDIDESGRWKNLLRSALVKNGIEVR